VKVLKKAKNFGGLNNSVRCW